MDFYIFVQVFQGNRIFITDIVLQVLPHFFPDCDSPDDVLGLDLRPPADRRPRGCHLPQEHQEGRRRPEVHVPRLVTIRPSETHLFFWIVRF